MTLRRAALFAVLMGAAGLPCVGVAADADPTGDWADAEKRTQAQLAIVEGMIDAGIPEEALRGIAEARAQGATDPRFDVLQARALHLAGLESEALAILETHVKRHSRDAEALALLGVVYADAERLNEALDALGRALRFAPRDAEILNNLGWVELAAGKPKDALEHLRASLAIDPGAARTRNNMGFALARLERDNEALEAFRAVNDEAGARFNLGLACEMRSDRTSAIAHYQAALAVRPDHAAAASALKRLLSGGSP